MFEMGKASTPNALSLPLLIKNDKQSWVMLPASYVGIYKRNMLVAHCCKSRYRRNIHMRIARSNISRTCVTFHHPWDLLLILEF